MDLCSIGCRVPCNCVQILVQALLALQKFCCHTKVLLPHKSSAATQKFCCHTNVLLPQIQLIHYCRVEALPCIAMSSNIINGGFLSVQDVRHSFGTSYCAYIRTGDMSGSSLVQTALSSQLVPRPQPSFLLHIHLCIQLTMGPTIHAASIRNSDNTSTITWLSGTSNVNLPRTSTSTISATLLWNNVSAHGHTDTMRRSDAMQRWLGQNCKDEPWNYATHSAIYRGVSGVPKPKL